MEFFEKAHVVKTKSSENVKKQLKKMLYGYKVSDNKLIQDSADNKNDYEDSTSVSGFSDLNLTNSSCEDMVESGPSFIDESSLVMSKNLDLLLNTTNLKDSSSFSGELQNTTSLLEDVTHEISSSSTHSSDLSASEILDSDTDSNSSYKFDPDGVLANKICKKLETLKAIKQPNKRKYHEIETNEYDHIPSTCEQKINEVHETSQESNSSMFHNVRLLTYNDEKYNSMSPDFVSIRAEGMPHQRLDDILGDYKYSTIRNLPSDSKHSIHTTNADFFVNEDDMSVDVHTEDEIDSLIPELDDIPALEEIDEAFNLDTTAETNIDVSINNSPGSAIMNESELIIEPQINCDELFKIYYTSKGCIIVLKHPSELFIQGKVKIRCLGGRIEIFGYTLKDELCDLYAPYYNFAQIIKTMENPNSYYGLFGKLTAAGLSVTETENIVTSVGDQDGIIFLQKLHRNNIEFIENNFKVTHLFTKANKLVEPYFKKVSDILKCTLHSIRPLNTFRVHPSWKEALTCAEKAASKGVVCGGKGVGKSTYLRYQVNKLIDKGPVLVVDLDPGQCEFTVAGNISATVVTKPLLGPNFTHSKTPEIMLNIGMINTMDNSSRYLNAVHALVNQCQEHETFSNMPWVINTMGMTTALGLKFITFIILVTKPNYLLQYESKQAKKRFDTFLRPHNIKLLYEEYKNDRLFINISCPVDLDYSFIVAQNTDSSEKNSFSLTPKDERYLNFLAYFSQLAHIQKNLLGITPYQVSLKDVCIGTNVVVKAESIMQVVNGKIVALCQQKHCDSARVFTLADETLLCHGHGLIRGIDWEKEMLYVITPVLGERLRVVDTLVYADWVPDLVGQENHLPEGTVVPYRTKTQDQVKRLMSTPRRRFNPLQLLKITRSAKIESMVN